MNELYYCRHGLTNDLEAGIRNRPEAFLTPEGVSQARFSAELLVSRNITPELIVCSGLLRARQTAEEIAGIIDAPIIQSNLLNERYCGVAVGMKNADIKMQFPDGFDTVPGAELAVDLQARAAEAASWISQFHEETILIVSHGVFGRAMGRHYENRPYTEEFDRIVRAKYNLKNGQVMQLSPGPVETLE